MSEVTSTKVQMYEEVRQELNTLLDDFFVSRVAQSSALSPQYGRLWRLLSGLSQAGGKRVRPYMLILAYRSFGGKDQSAVMPVAMAWELLHLCMLIHDDIIDNDFVRYGVKNIAGSYREIYKELAGDSDRQAHLADASALLAGDLALSSAYEVIVECDLPASVKLEAQRMLARSAYTVTGGELLDTEAALYPMSEADPLLIARLKTASYTFVGPLISGAVLAGASPADCEDMEKLGEALGCAYQLQDDLNGVFGDPLVTGKTAKGDLIEGKRTYLMQQTFLHASPEQNRTLRSLVGRPDMTDADAETIREIIISCGAKKLTEESAQTYIDEACRIVENLSISGIYKDEIQGLIFRMTGRQK